MLEALTGMGAQLKPTTTRGVMELAPTRVRMTFPAGGNRDEI